MPAICLNPVEFSGPLRKLSSIPMEEEIFPTERFLPLINPTARIRQRRFLKARRNGND
jgi:hypothetical protein